MSLKRIFQEDKINKWINKIKVTSPLFKIKIYEELGLIFF